MRLKLSLYHKWKGTLNTWWSSQSSLCTTNGPKHKSILQIWLLYCIHKRVRRICFDGIGFYTPKRRSFDPFIINYQIIPIKSPKLCRFVKWWSMETYFVGTIHFSVHKFMLSIEDYHWSLCVNGTHRSNLVGYLRRKAEENRPLGPERDNSGNRG